MFAFRCCSLLRGTKIFIYLQLEKELEDPAVRALQMPFHPIPNETLHPHLLCIVPQ